MTGDVADSGAAKPKIDTTISHSARIWNYWLGGKDNCPVDREMGDKIVAYVPELVRSARRQRSAGLAHARALLSSTPEGACDYIDADLREPGKILDQAAETLDFSQPVAIMMLGI